MIGLKPPRKFVRFQNPRDKEDAAEREDTAAYGNGHAIDTERIAHDLDDSNAVVHFDIDPQNSMFTFRAPTLPTGIVHLCAGSCPRSVADAIKVLVDESDDKHKLFPIFMVCVVLAKTISFFY